MMTDAPATARCGDEATEPVVPSVLFVDDEQEVLAGLRGTLRRLRKTYHFHFANGADEAIDILAIEPIDIVVTDMRMPVTNGVELLRQIKADHPDVVRYVLSGEAEQHLVLQAVPLAHRWLSKPFDRDGLSGALAEAARFRTLLADPELQAAVAGADALPTPPALYGELCTLLDDGEVSISVLAELVSEDGAISAKILQLANSAFSGGNRCDTIHDAIVRVGLSALSQMVLLAGVFQALEPADRVPGLDADLLRHHVGLVSTLAGELAEPGAATIARLGGLFSEIGLLLEAVHLPDRLAASYESALASGSTLLEAEEREHGVSYPQLGGHLLSVWGLPVDLVLATAGSHQPPPVAGRAPMPPNQAVQAARLAAQRFPHAERLGQPHLDRLDDSQREAVDLWLSRTPSWEGVQS